MTEPTIQATYKEFMAHYTSNESREVAALQAIQHVLTFYPDCRVIDNKTMELPISKRIVGCILFRIKH